MKALIALLLCLGIVFSAAVYGQDARPETSGAVPRAPTRPEKSLGHKILFYLPNRVLDLLDIFRLRLRVGPGVAAEARLTIYAANFAGQYQALYVGLPGPRLAPIWPKPAGLEEWKGLMVMGVDATDDSPHPPGYSISECNAGVHVLLLGLDFGVDPIEIGDFLTGFIMLDVRGDDL